MSTSELQIQAMAKQLTTKLKADIQEHRFEMRAKVRKLRDDLNSVIDALDANEEMGEFPIASRAAEIDYHRGQISVREHVLGIMTE